MHANINGMSSYYLGIQIVIRRIESPAFSTVMNKLIPKIFHKTSELIEICLVILGITSEPIFWVMLSVIRNF